MDKPFPHKVVAKGRVVSEDKGGFLPKHSAKTPDNSHTEGSPSLCKLEARGGRGLAELDKPSQLDRASRADRRFSEGREVEGEGMMDME